MTHAGQVQGEGNGRHISNRVVKAFRLFMKSQLKGKNKIKVANTWAVSLMRYGAGTIKLNKEELQEIDRKSRKFVTMNKELHPRSDVARICIPRKSKEAA